MMNWLKKLITSILEDLLEKQIIMLRSKILKTKYLVIINLAVTTALTSVEIRYQTLVIQSKKT